MKNQKGFTLIEMLIYMGLLSILLISITDMFVAVLNVKLESEATSAVEQDSQFIINRLNYDISRATNIAQPANPGDISTSLSLDIAGETFTYQLNGNNLELTNNSGTYAINSNQTTVPTLSFLKIGSPGGKATARITLEIESVTQTHAGTESKNFVWTVGTR